MAIFSYVHSSWLGEDVGVDVHHQVTSRRVLHDKTHMLWSLEACKQVDQEGVLRHVDRLEDALLTHQTGSGVVSKIKGTERERTYYAMPTCEWKFFFSGGPVKIFYLFPKMGL